MPYTPQENTVINAKISQFMVVDYILHNSTQQMVC
jgi:hypothetical protein